jgi:V/A-type H+-transporting ATPase subunit C
MQASSNAIISKTKGMYGTFLKESDYSQLSKLTTLPDLVSYLKSKDNYNNAFLGFTDNNIRRRQLELLIKRNFYNHIQRIIKYSFGSDSKFYHLNEIKQETDIILSHISHLISRDDETESETPLFVLDAKVRYDSTLLQRSTNFNELLNALNKTDYYKLLLPFVCDNPDDLKYLDIEHALEEYYYSKLFESIDKYYKGKVRKDLLYIYESRIEIANIVKIYRLKKFYKAEKNIINSVLIKKHNRLSERKLNELLSIANPDDILKYLSVSDIREMKGDDDYVYAEYYASNIKYNIAKKYMYFSNKVPLIYTSFYTLFEIEVENIINIIQGIRYQMDPSELRMMLIY